MKTDQISLAIARNKLLKLWFIGGFIPVSVLIVQTVLGSKYAGFEKEIWGWFCPLIFPPVTLMLGVVGAAAMDTNSLSSRTVNMFFFKIAFWASFFYLFMVLIVILLEPLSNSENPIKTFNTSNLFLSPIQGITVAALGFLFTTSKKEEK